MPSSTDKTPSAVQGAENELHGECMVKCRGCGCAVPVNALADAWQVCPYCGYHYPLSAWKRIELLADLDSFVEMDGGIVSCDQLDFASDGSYPAELRKAMETTGMNDAVVCGRCLVGGVPTALAVMDCRFMGGRMGSVVGEKIARLAEYAIRSHRALVIVAASDGARVQEGAIGLVQMAKTSAALMRFDEAALPYVSVLTNPTAGCVEGSFASLGDVIFAEPGALVGFSDAGDVGRMEGTEKPGVFQAAEFMLEHGFIDQVVPRARLKDAVVKVLSAWKWN